jgi:arylsulfatase A-like enzyme
VPADENEKVIGSAVEPDDAEEAAISEAPARPEGLAAATLPSILFAAIFAIGFVAVETLVCLFKGSYLAWSIIFTAAAFWGLVAAVGTAALALVMMPVLAFVKGRFRAAILPAIIVAAGYGACVLNASLNYLGPDSSPAGKETLLNPVFVSVVGLTLALVAAFLAARGAHSRRWAAMAVTAAAVLFGAGLSWYVPAKASLFVLTLAGPAATVIYAAIVEGVKAARGSAFAFCAVALLAAVLGIMAPLRGEAPLPPIDHHAKANPGKVAMLADPPNVVLVVIDTARGDHFSVCGYKYPTTPNLEALAKDCRFYPYAETVDSWTLPAHASMFTGKWPRLHGAHATSDEEQVGIEKSRVYGVGLAPSQRTIASYLSEAGYATGAIAANYTWLCRQFGLDQGFGYYYDLPRMNVFTLSGGPVFKIALDAVDRIRGCNGKLMQTFWDAESVNGMSESWLDAHKESPFFLFVNYMDCHYPYSAPPPFDHIDGPGTPYNRALRQGSWDYLISAYINGEKGLNAGILGSAINQYDGGIALADHAIGELVAKLKRDGLYDNTLLIVTSDHGEFFGEHGRLNHGVGLYEGGLRVPILVKYPKGRCAGQVVTDRVSLIDIFATIADETRIKTDAVPALPLGERGTHAVVAEDFENGMNVKRYGERFRGTRAATYDGDWKIITSTKDGDELYNLTADPAETSDVSKSSPDETARLAKTVTDWRQATPEFDGSKEVRQAPSKQDVEKLKSLNYVQ